MMRSFRWSRAWKILKVYAQKMGLSEVQARFRGEFLAFTFFAGTSPWSNAGWARRAPSRTRTTSSIQTPGTDGVLLGGSVRYVGRFDHHLEDWFDCNWCEIQFTYRTPATCGAVCRRRVRTVQTVQKPRRLNSEVLGSVFTCLSLCSDRCFGPDSAVLSLTLQGPVPCCRSRVVQ